MRLLEITTPRKEQRELPERTTILANRRTIAAYDETQNEPQEMSASGNLAPPRVPPASQANRYVVTRELWTVSYEGDGIRSYGRVVGFGEAGWHIVGEAPVQAGKQLSLRVYRPDRSRTFCVPSATVQGVQGHAFVIQVQLHAAS